VAEMHVTLASKVYEGEYRIPEHFFEEWRNFHTLRVGVTASRGDLVENKAISQAPSRLRAVRRALRRSDFLD
jgi:hypothetical protein